MAESPSGAAPLSQDCQVVELRQYTLHPGQRDVLVELFDREFIEPQEALGMRVIGQFRDLAHADRFVWLRGFTDMTSRAKGLQSFYGGPVWAAHRNAANATMIDSDNVLLLRPAWAGSAITVRPEDRAAPGATQTPRGVVDATLFTLKQPADAGLLAFCRDRMSRVLRDGGAKVLGWYVTEPAANNFPRLPVREGVNVLVGFALFEDAGALAAFEASAEWQRDVAPDLAGRLAQPPEPLRLTPTARSAIHS
ncbi:MAG: NIPSNAP family protein [Ramlibacter sp.]